MSVVFVMINMSIPTLVLQNAVVLGLIMEFVSGLARGVSMSILKKILLLILVPVLGLIEMFILWNLSWAMVIPGGSVLRSGMFKVAILALIVALFLVFNTWLVKKYLKVKLTTALLVSFLLIIPIVYLPIYFVNSTNEWGGTFVRPSM